MLSLTELGDRVTANHTRSDADSGRVSPAKNWFAAFVTPRHEKRVEQHCRVRGIESFLPLLQVRSRWKDGSKRVLQLPLFPTYIFVRIGCGERTSVLRVPGIKWIVGARNQIAPLADTYINFLQEGLRLGKIEPHPYLTAGTRVRIRSGVMAGMEGVLIRKKNNCRVVLTLDVIMKSVTVEVEIEDIEPVAGGLSSPLCQPTAQA
jgi:transcription antitermination factor NusG